jgi:predicted PurR-regulated permease PerM
MNNNTINYKITNGTIVRIMLWASLAYGLYFFRDLVLTLIVGLVMASTIDPIAKYFSKFRIPRVITVASIFLILLASLVGVIAFVLPLLIDDFINLLTKIPKILNDVSLFGRDLGLRDVSTYLTNMSKEISKGQILNVIKNSIVGASNIAVTTGNIIGSVVNFVLMIVFSFYLAVQDNGINNFLKLITPRFYEKYILDLWARSERKIGSWAKGQIVVGLVIGVLVYVPLKIIGMPYASLFAFLAFLGEMIPVVGLLLASIPAIIMGYFSGGLYFALIIAAVFFVISQLENYVIYPKIMNSVIGVPAIIILISFIVGAQLAGFWGIVLAVPIAAIVMEFVNDVVNEKIPSRDSQNTIRYE